MNNSDYVTVEKELLYNIFSSSFLILRGIPSLCIVAFFFYILFVIIYCMRLRLFDLVCAYTCENWRKPDEVCEWQTKATANNRMKGTKWVETRTLRVYIQRETSIEYEINPPSRRANKKKNLMTNKLQKRFTVNIDHWVSKMYPPGHAPVTDNNSSFMAEFVLRWQRIKTWSFQVFRVEAYSGVSRTGFLFCLHKFMEWILSQVFASNEFVTRTQNFDRIHK